MLIELKKEDLIRMVNGSQPKSYEQMDHPLFKKAGHYIGGFTERWEWSSLENLTERELYRIYILCTKD